MKRLRLLVSLSLLVTLPTGCAVLLDVLRATVQEPTLTFQSVALTDVSLTGLTLDTAWRLDNPNAVEISLASIEYALSVENAPVISGSPAQGLQIPAQGSTVLHFPATVTFQSVGILVQTFASKDTATYKVGGAIGVQTPMGVLKLPLEKQGTFEVPKLPAVQFSPPRIASLSLLGATIEFPLEITNRNSFELPVDGITGSVFIAGERIGNISTGNLGRLGDHGKRMVTLPLTVSFLNTAQAVISAVQNGQAQVRLEASLQSGSAQLPIKTEQLLNFTR